MSRSWVAVVPVKRLDTAKSRLGGDVGDLRRELALAMALDTVGVAASCPDVRVVVVTDDPDVARAARHLGAQIVTDEPRAGINAALVHGARTALPRPDVGIAAMAADLPSLRRAELVLALGRAWGAGPSHRGPSFLPDAAGTGSTLYTAGRLGDFWPRFGPASAAAHAAVASTIAMEGLASVRQDVDTIDDLRAAARLGLNPRTADVVTRLPGPGLRALRRAS